jgi:hypothetical protein
MVNPVKVKSGSIYLSRVKIVVVSLVICFALCLALLASYGFHHRAAASSPSTFACTGRSFYVDHSSGNDSSSGTSTSSPWQNVPGMADFAGNYSPMAGDCFYFKGGVTWPNASFPLTITGSGTASATNYYGPDYSWYSGSSWSRPVFNAGGATIAGSKNEFVDLEDNTYVTLDNIEMTGFYWDNDPAYATCNYVNAYGTENDTITNMYFHGWAYGSSASDGCVLVQGDTTAPFSAGDMISNSVFDGSDSTGGGDSMEVTYAWSNFENNVCNHLPNCYLGNGGTGNNTIVSGNLIENCSLSFGGNHENAIETIGASNYYIYNNVIHDTPLGCETMFVGNPGETDYIWNNVAYNLSGNMPEFDSSTALYFWNNTIAPPSEDPCLKQGRTTDSTTTVQIINNHCITNYGSVYYQPGTVTNPSQNNNVLQTLSAAATDGYSTSSNYAYDPTLGSGATVGTGANLSSECSGLISSLCSSTGYSCNWIVATESVSCPAIMPSARPSSGTWDVGAYVYSIPSAKVGDLNGDGSVNAADLTILISAWGSNDTAIASNLGNSGPVGIIDMSILLNHWGQ